MVLPLQRGPARTGPYDDVRIGAGGGPQRSRDPRRAARRAATTSGPIPPSTPVARALLDAEGIVTPALAPIAFGGRVEGLLYVANRRPVPFTAQDEGVVQRLADQGATALRNVNLFAAEQSARSAAEAANRMKDEFLATVSHELRTPLTAMLGWIWWLRRGPVDEAVQERALETVERNARAQAQLVEDLLDVSRIVTGKLRLDVRPVDLRARHRGGHRQRAHRGRGQGHRARSASAARRRVEIRSTPIACSRWSGTCSRTRSSSRPAAGASTSRSRPRPARGAHHRRRHGHGISPAFLPLRLRPLPPGRRARARARTAASGSASPIVRHLVELHGGTVRAESAGEGRGATFTVTLPVRLGRRRAPEEPDAPLDRERRSAMRRHGRSARRRPRAARGGRRGRARAHRRRAGAAGRHRHRRRLRSPARARRSRERRPTCSSATSACAARTATR